MLRSRSLLFLTILIAFRPTWCQGGEDDDDDADIEEELLTVEQLRGLHTHFDENKDGKVSFQEIIHYSKKIAKAIAFKDMPTILEELDSSKDGKLSLQEHLEDIQTNQVMAVGNKDEADKEMERHKTLESKKFAAADSNGDQALDATELSALLYPETHESVLALVAEETLRFKDTDGDGKLSVQEFWEAVDSDGDGGELSDEEKEDFAKLDANGDGFLNLDELRVWESGVFHTESAMKSLFEIADKDSDMHVTADELVSARERIGAGEAQYHLMEWAEHHEL